MTDERPTGDGEHDDALPPPFRPWAASGVPQPGADRPDSGSPDVGDALSRRGRVPAPPVPPVYPADAPPAAPEWYAPVDGAPAVPRPSPAVRPPPSTVLPPPPAAGARPRPATVGSVLAPILALLAAGTSWLPWFKTPTAGLLTLSDSRFVRVLNVWDVPVRFLWSYHSPRGGPSLGWFVLGIAAGILVLGFVGARGAARLLAGLGALMALLFLVQIARLVDDAPSIGGVDIGVTDFVGLGAYLLFVLSFVLMIVPRD